MPNTINGDTVTILEGYEFGHVQFSDCACILVIASGVEKTSKQNDAILRTAWSAGGPVVVSGGKQKQTR